MMCMEVPETCEEGNQDSCYNIDGCYYSWDSNTCNNVPETCAEGDSNSCFMIGNNMCYYDWNQYMCMGVPDTCEEGDAYSCWNIPGCFLDYDSYTCESYYIESMDESMEDSDSDSDSDESLGELMCAAHSDCPSWSPFCYEGYCDSCEECHYCLDGIDGTCGSCGSGYPTREGPCEGSDESMEESMDEATEEPEPICEDGDEDTSDPCAPLHCANNEWLQVIVDCAEQMGMECLAEWMPAAEGECCSTCPCDDIMCTAQVCDDGSNPPVPSGECCGDMSLCPVSTDAPTEPQYLVPDLGLIDSMKRVLQRSYTVSRLRSAGRRAAALLQEKDEDGNKLAPYYDPEVKGYLQKIRRFFKADESTYSEEIYNKQRNQYNNIARALGLEEESWE